VSRRPALTSAAHRAGETLVGIHALPKLEPPLAVDALPLARSLWELFIVMEYVCEDEASQDHWAFRYLAHAIAQRRHRLLEPATLARRVRSGLPTSSPQAAAV